MDLVVEAPSWGASANLCESEPFADQPALALCSGVLVDWDLVLTAGHCMRQLPLGDLAVVFGYYYATAGELAIRDADVIEIVEIVDEALDPAGVNPRLDYAWLRLATPVRLPRRPARIHARADALEPGAQIVSMGTGGGVPTKIDPGAQVRDLRQPWFDYFIADADTTKGSSGGAGFDRNLALLEIENGRLSSIEAYSAPRFGPPIARALLPSRITLGRRTLTRDDLPVSGAAPSARVAGR